MKLWSILGNSQRLDGGAMFGNAPRALWERWMPADALHRIDLGCRALLVREGERNILVETGIGAFFSPELKQRFGVQEERHVLLASLRDAGFSHEDIDVVVLSHMEHHANIVPWHMLVAERGIELRWIPLTDDGQLDLSNLSSLLDGAKVLSFTAMSNVLGTITPVKRLCAAAHAAGAGRGAGMTHARLDVRGADADIGCVMGGITFSVLRADGGAA